ncbi:hypothetical protein RRG08_043153 [Elysia crispata]|uniref:Copper type II ascorbate-dependent monooxygenase N-terminal domain-containing protein n=1 Tax=Elysia crispata TaxID=231223 RepID=A0AAE1CZM9_9GAST|nr:hypothetical protein RRG08_043153 [Elysia crispata]
MSPFFRIPDRVTDITHPGVCDPYDSPQCQGRNQFVNCEVDKFDQCDAIDDPAIRTLDLRFPPTQIPATETNYYCMTFNLPSDQDYHIVANEGIIDNANVVHHQLIYACESDVPDRSTPGGCVEKGRN